MCMCLVLSALSCSKYAFSYFSRKYMDFSKLPDGSKYEVFNFGTYSKYLFATVIMCLSEK